MSFIDHSIETHGESQRELRPRRLIRATLLSHRMDSQEILIRNVSCNGFGASSRGLPPLSGDQIQASLPGGWLLAGTVRWVKGPNFGVQFDQPINLDELAAAIARASEMAMPKSDWQVSRLHRVTTDAGTGNLRKIF